MAAAPITTSTLPTTSSSTNGAPSNGGTAATADSNNGVKRKADAGPAAANVTTKTSIPKKAKTNDGKAKAESSSDSDSSDSDDDKPILAKIQKAAAPATPAKKPSVIPKKTPVGSAAPVKSTGVKPAGAPAAAAAGGAAATASSTSSSSSTAPAKKESKGVKDESSSSDSSSDDSSDTDSSDSDDSDDGKKKKPAAKKAAGGAKKPAAKKKAAPKKKAAGDSSDDDSDAPAKGKGKKGEKKGAGLHAQQLQDAGKYQQRAEIVPLKPTQGANKWWNRKIEKNVKWETLEHNGVLFPPPYEPHGIHINYNGEPIKLQPEAEEIATFYASMLESDHVKGAVFNKNFWHDWKEVLDKDPKNKVMELKKVDFRPIFEHLRAKREETKVERKLPEVKKKLKEEKDLLLQTYGIAIVDGFREKVGNFRVEPPSLFRGRGKHPKTGHVKRRLVPEDVTINVGKNVPIPKCPPGHKWKGILHNNKVTWLAYWKDTVTKKDFKYVFLAAASRFKGESDMKKYTKAQLLKTLIHKIRASYNKDMVAATAVQRQMATAIYLIDILALRVGNEKDKDTQADTVGCTSLRVEHIEFKEGNIIILDFLGKDSMRYFNEVKVDPRVWKNLNEFVKDKSKDEKIFDRVTPTELNTHLKEFMKGLSAKVFRTYNASVTLQNELKKVAGEDIDDDALVQEKVAYYTAANRTVAILCNHQRSVPKGHNDAMTKLQDTLESHREQKEELEDYLHELETGKKRKPKVKKEKKDPPSSPKKRSTDPDKIKEQLARLEDKIRTQEAKIQTKEEGKTVALGTSKINYMDPRITVAWCKRKQVPIEKIFGRSLLEKFPWAMEVSQDWEF